MDLSKIPNKLVGNEDERAVSPVIGVILMVAITVILAAVIAAFVLDLGDTSQNPQASFDINQEHDDSNVSISIRSADRLDDVHLRGCSDADSVFGDDLGVGNSITVNVDDSEDGNDGNNLGDFECEGGEEINIIGVYDGTQQTIQTWEVEDYS